MEIQQINHRYCKRGEIFSDQLGIIVISILSDIFERQNQGRENNSLFE